MASSSARGARVVGDYMLGRQIGSGSFSVVWHARHRVRGTEVAVKEIVMERLSKKLQDSLLSEIVILKRIHHPNIISLYDIIEASGRMYLVLEYCRGGDLALHIQRHGRVQEATARHFMQQLAAGLQVLRENNIIHRDLKPQNLLLSATDDNSTLKIADFGFARSLQPRGLAETLCGSPLYMAPEIMQLQKYDAKADLWSVGAILFQLVTGKTPFTGNNQIQLLQNIIKTNELHFPPNNGLSHDCINLCQKLLRRNPVERLTFEEFFNHQFLLERPSDVSLSRMSSMSRDCSPLVEHSPARPSVEGSQEDFLPFLLDDESGRQDGSLSVSMNKASTRPMNVFSGSNKVDKSPVFSPPGNMYNLPIYDDRSGLGTTDSRRSRAGSRQNSYLYPDGGVQENLSVMDQKPSQSPSEVVDPLEFVDQEYVLVPGPPLELSSSSSVSRQHNSPTKVGSSPVASPKTSSPTAPMPIVGAGTRTNQPMGSLGSQSSPASGTSQGSIDACDAIEQPSVHCMIHLRSLQQSALIITDLVNEKIKDGKRLEAFSIQLVILAIWKQALHICHAQAASAIEGSPSQVLPDGEVYKKISPGSQERMSSLCAEQPDAVCQQIEREFLLEVGNAENLARDVGQVAETTEMPDPIEIIFQSALTLGRHGAVNEMMDHSEKAATMYSKAVQLLSFLLVEAPSLILNPPFSLTNSDRYRLRSYIDILNNRQDQSRSQRMALLKCEDQ